MPEGRVSIAGVEISPDHYIGGKRIKSKERFLDRSPIDGTALAEISAGGKAEAEMACECRAPGIPRVGGGGA